MCFVVVVVVVVIRILGVLELVLEMSERLEGKGDVLERRDGDGRGFCELDIWTEGLGE